MGLLEICEKATGVEIRSRMAALLPALCDQVLASINDPLNSPLSYERLMLYEMLVAVSNSLDDVAAQSRFMEDIVSGPLQQWCDPELSAMIRDPIAHHAALIAQPMSQVLINGKRALNLITGIARRGLAGSSKLFGKYWVNVLPNLFAWIYMIHYIWKDREKFKPLLCIHPDELQFALGRSVNRRPQDGSRSPKSASWNLTHFLTAMRDTLYGNLNTSFKYSHGFYDSPEALAQFPETVLCDLQYIENRHLAKLLTVVVGPFVFLCPPSAMGSMTKVLMNVLGHMSQRLATCWDFLLTQNASQLSDRWNPVLLQPLLEDDQEGEMDLDMQIEIARDAAIRMLGVSFADFLGVVLSTTPDDIIKDPKEVFMTQVCAEILKSDEEAAAVLLSLVACVYCPDANCCNKATTVLRRIFYCGLLQQERFHRFVADQLFLALFGCLFKPKTRLIESHAHQVLLLLTNVWVFILTGDMYGVAESSLFEVDVNSQYRASVNRTLMASIPNLPQESILALEQNLSKTPGEKGKRNIVKEFVQSCVHSMPEDEKQVLFKRPENNAKVQNLPLTIPSGGPPLSRIDQNSWHTSTSAWDTGVQALFKNDQ